MRVPSKNSSHSVAGSQDVQRTRTASIPRSDAIDPHGECDFRQPRCQDLDTGGQFFRFGNDKRDLGREVARADRYREIVRFR